MTPLKPLSYRLSGLFWLCFFAFSIYLYHIGALVWIGEHFITPLLPKDSCVSGSQLLICCLILMFFGGPSYPGKR
jgi:hypothetical protein